MEESAEARLREEIRRLTAEVGTLVRRLAILDRRISLLERRARVESTREQFLQEHMREAPTAIETAPEPQERITAPAPPPQETTAPAPSRAFQRESPFLSQEEFEKPTEDTAASVAEAEPLDREVAFATTWLPRIGGVLLLAGAAFGAALIQPHLTPALRLAIAYAVAFGLALGGLPLQRRIVLLGRAVTAIGIALAFFASFASHWVPPTQCFSAPVALTLMVLFTGASVGLAERWRSEVIAGMAFGLGVLAVLVSARTSQSFALIGLGVLAGGSGALLVRHEWLRLTAVALAGTYLATLALWFLMPVGKGTGEIAAHLGALIAYHALFTLAFWRWGRVWAAREMAMETSVSHDAAPEIPPTVLPYSTGFAILNTVGLVSLSLFLLWRTQTLWAHVDWLLFGLAAVEAGRLCIRTLRVGPLASFHAVTALALLVAGTASALSGLSESVVLAAEALLISIAASRAPLLRVLRPLTALCAGMAVMGYGSLSLVTVGDFAQALVPPLLLLASTLPWEAIWVVRPRPYATGWLAGAENVSGLFRAAVAAGLMIFVIVDYVTLREPRILTLEISALAVLIVAVFLRAQAWVLGLLLLFLAAMTGPLLSSHVAATLQVVSVLWLLVAVHLWHQLGGSARGRLGRIVLALAVVPIGMVAGPFSAHAVQWSEPLRGAVLAALATVAFLLAHWADGLPLLRSIIPMPPDELEEPPSPRGQVLLGQPLRFGHLVALTVGIAAVIFAAVVDSRTNLLSAAIIVAALVGGWLTLTRRAEAPETPEWLLIVGALAIASLAVSVYAEFHVWALLVVEVLAACAAGMGLARRRFPAAASGLGFLAALPLALYPFHVQHAGTPSATLGLVACAGLILSTRLANAARPLLENREQLGPERRRLGPGVSAWICAAAALVALLLLREPGLVPKTLVTVSWGLAGAALLVLGFAFADRPMRFVSLGVFAVSIGRIFVVDLTGTSMLTRTLALCGVGLLLIGAAVLYGLRRQRVATQGKMDL